jgi:UDP-N-acetylmuramoyl-tripeptide--D-alanyl-D-alanine ligase
MMSMQLSDAAQVLDGRQVGDDVLFTGISTDTRTLDAGNLFVALRGPNFDGHRYIEQAQQRGAVAAAVSHVVKAALPQLEVEDTRLALGSLAAHWRHRFDIPLLAVTGSNGKTTVKEMLAAVLRRCGTTLVTQGNFNNDIGVPHTLFGLGPEHDYAVLELGANHPGEIAYLTSLVQPMVAVINNAGPAHLEGFGSLEGVARAKGELFDSAGAAATCVINADDPFASLWRTLAEPRPVITFGLDREADVSARWQGDIAASDIQISTPRGSAETRLALPGRHNVMNALAAAAAALAVGVDVEVIAAGLADVQPVRGRWQALSGIAGARIINDTYNANPASLEAGLALLSAAAGETWLVLGDMGELGDTGRQLHEKMGKAARRAGVQRLFTLGALAVLAAEAFGDGASAFTDMDELIGALRGALHADATVLVKGSRAMRMERVVEALAATGAAPGGTA